MTESAELLRQLVASAERAGLNGYHAVRRMLPHVPAAQIEAAWAANETDKVERWWADARAEIDVAPLLDGGS